MTVKQVLNWLGIYTLEDYDTAEHILKQYCRNYSPKWRKLFTDET